MAETKSMKIEKNDRRNEVTEKLIRDTFFELLDEYPLEKITVRKLCEKAQINRSTFYAHYMDLRDVIEQITNNYYEDVAKAYEATVDDDADDTDFIHLNKIAFSAEYGKKILKYPEIFVFGDKHKNIDNHYISYLCENSTLSQEEAYYLYSFITCGLMGMSKRMIDHGDFSDLIEPMEELINGIIKKGLK